MLGYNNGACDLVVIVGTTISVPSHPCHVTTTHLKIIPVDEIYSTWSSNDLLWLELKIVHPDGSPIDGHQGDTSHQFKVKQGDKIILHTDQAITWTNIDQVTIMVSSMRDNPLNGAGHLAVIVGTTILAPSHSCQVTATHVKIGHP